MRGRPYKILADVKVTDPGCSGVVFAHGSRFGGHALIIKNRKLHYVCNFLGIKPGQKFVSPELEPAKYTLGMEFTRESAGEHGESLGTTKLHVNDKVVAQGDMRTQAGKFTLSGDGLCIGRDSGDAVSREYQSPGTFTGGTVLVVGVTVEQAQYLDLETLAVAALAVDQARERPAPGADRTRRAPSAVNFQEGPERTGARRDVSREPSPTRCAGRESQCANG